MMTTSCERSETLEALLARVAETCPSLADPFEATAIVESFGYTDRIIQEEIGEPDSRTLGAIIYQRLAGEAGAVARPEPHVVRGTRVREELRVIAQTCSLSLIYSMPWIAAFVMDRSYPDFMQMPADAAAPLSVALMASLILSGGFVQCIARKGQFYTGLSQPRLGAVVCWRIWQAGLATGTVAALAGVLMGLYFEVFQPRYLLLSAWYFEALTALWMTNAILWLDRTYWQVPGVFAAGGVAFWITSHAGNGALAATIASTAAALAAALILACLRSPLWRGTGQNEVLRPPRYPVLVRSLAPYFCYGLGYFSLVFADRIAAGTAVSTAAGVQFSIDSGYKHGMDLSLLLFLTSMTAVEYINFNFMRFWQAEARRWTPAEGVRYRARLSSRYTWARVWIVGVYASVALVVWLADGVPGAESGPLTLRVMTLGVIGYLLLELALFNVLVLFSVNAAFAVLQALAPALAIDAGLGYVLSNTLGPLWAAAAMAAGAGVFLWLSEIHVRVALGRPGYHFYVS
jgi:hypothetical protein